MFLVVGFGALSVGILVAWTQPATNYEVSIFAGTPIGYWSGIGIAYLTAGLVLVVRVTDDIAGLAALLGGLATVSFVGLPVIRGYRFHGLADALTHLGWARGLQIGSTDFFDLFYPATHTMSALFAELTGIDIEQSMMAIFVVLIGMYLVFIPLSIWAIAFSHRALVIGAFSGFLLLPFTTISTHLHFHTYSLAILYIPLLLYVLVRFLISDNERPSLSGSVNRWQVALLLGGIALVFAHPQVKLNVILLLGGLVGLQGLYRIHRIELLNPLRTSTLIFTVLSVVWLVWMFEFPDRFGTADRIITAVVDTLYGRTSPGETVASHRVSAEAVGGGLSELFAKMFLIPVVYGFLTVYAFSLAVIGREQIASLKSRKVMTQIGIAGVILIPFILAHYAGEMDHLFFRHVGFALVIATIFGAIGIHLAIDHLWSQRIPPVARPVAVVLLAILLVFSLLVTFPSPYIYSHNHHGTHQEMTGYTTTYDHIGDDRGVTGIRVGYMRYAAALGEDDERPPVPTIMDGDVLSSPDQHAPDDFYLSISEADIQREVTAYQGLRFTTTDFDHLDDAEGVDLILDSGEFRLYLVRGTG